MTPDAVMLLHSMKVSLEGEYFEVTDDTTGEIHVVHAIGGGEWIACSCDQYTVRREQCGAMEAVAAQLESETHPQRYMQ